MAVLLTETMSGDMADQEMFRLLRATVFAVVCVLLGAFGHGLSSGQAPPVLGLICGIPLIVLLTGWLSGRQRRLPTIAAAVTGAQLGLHVLFDYAAAIPAASNAAAQHYGHPSGHAEHAACPCRRRWPWVTSWPVW